MRISDWSSDVCSSDLHIASLSVNEKLAKMRHISLIIESNRDSFSTAFVDRAIDEKLQALKDAGDKGLANYASTYLDRPLAKQLLQAMRRENPEQLDRKSVV